MIKSLQIIDTLRIGGAERMAINIANSLSCNYIESHLCVTREEGELKKHLRTGDRNISRTRQRPSGDLSIAQGFFPSIGKVSATKDSCPRGAGRSCRA